MPLEVQLGIPYRSSPMAKDIKPGTVFFGSLHRDSPMIPHLRLTGGGIVNLATFQLARIESPETVIYNYEEITDAILTRTSFAGLFSDIHAPSIGRTIDEFTSDKMDSKETT